MRKVSSRLLFLQVLNQRPVLGDTNAGILAFLLELDLVDYVFIHITTYCLNPMPKVGLTLRDLGKLDSAGPKNACSDSGKSLKKENVWKALK